MLLNFFELEKGGLGYVLRDLTARILAGCPNLTQGLIKTISGRQRFTAGVLTELKPLEDNVQGKAIRGAEYQFRAGLPKESLDITWVKHTGKNRDESHFVASNIELITGKPYSLYIDQIDRHRFRAWQELFNLTHSLPDPSSRLRVRPDYSKSRLSTKHQDALMKIWLRVHEKVESGLVTNRTELDAYLHSIGYKVRAKTYAGKPLEQPVLKLPDGVLLRLKGSIYYRRDFSPSMLNPKQESPSPKAVETRILELRTTIANGLHFRAHHTIGRLFGQAEQRRVEPGNAREHLAELLQVKLEEWEVAEPILPMFSDDGIKQISKFIELADRGVDFLKIPILEGIGERNSNDQPVNIETTILSGKSMSVAASLEPMEPAHPERKVGSNADLTSVTDPTMPTGSRAALKRKNEDNPDKADAPKATPSPVVITRKKIGLPKEKPKKPKPPTNPGNLG